MWLFRAMATQCARLGRVFEHLSLKQMLKIENPQDKAMEYALHLHRVKVAEVEEGRYEKHWQSIVVPSFLKLATDSQNPLKQFY